MNWRHTVTSGFREMTWITIKDRSACKVLASVIIFKRISHLRELPWPRTKQEGMCTTCAQAGYFMWTCIQNIDDALQHAMLATYCNQRSPKRHYVSTPICQAPIYHKRAQEAFKHGMTIGLLLKSIWQYLPDDRMKSVSVHAIIHTLGEKPLIRKTIQGFLVECVCRIKWTKWQGFFLK